MTQLVSLSLGAEIVYVTGIVNRKDYTFTLSGTSGGGTVWQSEVDRSTDDIYNISITAIDSRGATNTFNTVLYYGILNLITDRTYEDVERVQYLMQKGWANMTEVEQTEWLASLKGAYNASDLNRVGQAVQYVADRLNANGIAIIVNPKTNWFMQDIPTEDELTKYLNDVAAIRAAISVFATTPEVPESMNKLGYIEANNIEQILVDVDRLITLMMTTWIYSGEVYAGEV